MTADRVATHNARAFVAFRVLFNTRYYYPVFAVLFLDLGVNAAQFGWLNAVWAAAIVLMEVPSGALADRFGRRRLVMVAAVLMVLEMALLVAAPVRGGAALFAVLLLNRVASGLAEACASGADEALAYDALAAAGRAGEWPGVMERLSRATSMAFVVAMVAGAALYDASVLNRGLAALGIPWRVTADLAHRLPIWATLLHAGGALAAAWSLRECVHERRPEVDEPVSAWHGIRAAAAEIAASPGLRLVMAVNVWNIGAVLFFMCVVSVFFRLIGIGDAWFGVAGAALALLAMPAASAGRWIAEKRGLREGLMVTSLAGLAGFLLVAPVAAGWGLLGLALVRLGNVAGMVVTSHHMHGLTAARWRATVVSFGGLGRNLMFGLWMGVFSLATAGLTNANEAVRVALGWSPAIVAAGLIGIAVTLARGVDARS